MNIQTEITKLLLKYIGGLKASKIANMLDTTSHDINIVLYENRVYFEMDDMYVWRINKITRLLYKNPDGLKASQLASLLGITSREVNKYLYSNKKSFEKDDKFIWKFNSESKKFFADTY